MGALVPIGRVLLATIFVISGFGHFSGEAVAYAEAKNVPLASLAVPVSGVLALLGGLSVAFGLKARYGAALLVLFLVPVTLMMHNFWAIEDAAAAQMERVNFLKNLGLLGGALLVLHWGAGPVSVDAQLRRRAASPAPPPPAPAPGR